MKSIAWTDAGAAAWTLLEYLIHDRLGHRSPLHNPFGIEHMAHHATTSYFAPAWKKALAAMIVISGTGAALAPLMGRQAAFAFATGLTGMYALYEIIHRRTHTHAPRGRYGRFLRRHHFYHHFHDPRANFGVTSPFWDLVFGTYARPGVIRVPQNTRCPGFSTRRPERSTFYSRIITMSARASSRRGKTNCIPPLARPPAGPSGFPEAARTFSPRPISARRPDGK